MARPLEVELLFDNTQSTQFQLIVETCNNDIW
jgi:hypothetical protein